MKTLLTLTLATIATPCLYAEHESEPKYGYYRTEGGIGMRYDEDGDPYWVSSYADIFYTLPDENWREDIDLRVQFNCYADPETKNVDNVYIQFWIDVLYKESSRDLERRVTFRFHDRLRRKNLDGHQDNLRFFTLTNSTTYTSGNYIADSDFVDEVLKELLDEGRITVEVSDDGRIVRFIVVSRPAPHQTSDMFDVVSRCNYGMKHPNVRQDSSVAPSQSLGVGGDSLWQSQVNKDYMNKIQVVDATNTSP